jgi:hypothetical protein
MMVRLINGMPCNSKKAYTEAERRDIETYDPSRYFIGDLYQRRRSFLLRMWQEVHAARRAALEQAGGDR